MTSDRGCSWLVLCCAGFRSSRGCLISQQVACIESALSEAIALYYFEPSSMVLVSVLYIPHFTLSTVNF